MKWHDFLTLIADEPVFSSALFRIWNISAQQTKQQLVRWIKTGKIIQLRRGVYMLAEPYRKKNPHPFLIANRLKRASYISLQSALAYYGMIPEYVPMVTSITTGRPEHLHTKAGEFLYRHVKLFLFKDFHKIEIFPAQFAFIATPEKALLDLLYLTPGSDTAGYTKELRLQNSDTINLNRLSEIACSSKSTKFRTPDIGGDFHATFLS